MIGMGMMLAIYGWCKTTVELHGRTSRKRLAQDNNSSGTRLQCMVVVKRPQALGEARWR